MSTKQLPSLYVKTQCIELRSQYYGLLAQIDGLKNLSAELALKQAETLRLIATYKQQAIDIDGIITKISTTKWDQ